MALRKLRCQASRCCSRSRTDWSSPANHHFQQGAVRSRPPLCLKTSLAEVPGHGHVDDMNHPDYLEDQGGHGRRCSLWDTHGQLCGQDHTWWSACRPAAQCTAPHRPRSSEERRYSATAAPPRASQGGHPPTRECLPRPGGGASRQGPQGAGHDTCHECGRLPRTHVATHTHPGGGSSKPCAVWPDHRAEMDHGGTAVVMGESRCEGDPAIVVWRLLAHSL